MTLTDDLQYGLEWAFDNNLGGGDSGQGLLDLGGNLAPQAGFLTLSPTVRGRRKRY